MVKDIVTDEAVLSQKCEAATADDAAIVEDLLDTLSSLDEAACLAANQIGVPKAVVAYLDEADEPQVMFNPKLRKALRPFKALETCFSREGEAKVTRFDWVDVTYDELVDGELVARRAQFTAWPAQVIQHMIDHCNGKLV